MICCLVLTAVLLLSAGAAAGVGSLWPGPLTDLQMKYSGPLMILALILCLAGVVLNAFSLEMCLRLRKQIKRVMDPSLLKTSNFHEVKHWIEPGKYIFILSKTFHEKNSLELISFGWGQFDFDEEAKLLDQNKLRKHQKRQQV